MSAVQFIVGFYLGDRWRAGRSMGAAAGGLLPGDDGLPGMGEDGLVAFFRQAWRSEAKSCCVPSWASGEPATAGEQADLDVGQRVGDQPPAEFRHLLVEGDHQAAQGA